MKLIHKIGIVFSLFITLVSCDAGYKKENGTWVWVSYDEGAGRRVNPINLSHFIELNPEYNWLDTLGMVVVITGEWGTGETNKRKFKGFQEIEKAE